MKAEDIRNVLIVGSGTMGQEIGFQCALAGLVVTLYDISDEVLSAAFERLQVSSAMGVENGLFTAEERAAGLANIRTSSNLKEAMAEADFVSESVPERLELKRDVWAEIAEHAPAHTIFTTNTSSLRPSGYAHATGRPERFAAFHFHLPIAVNRIADVMTHGGTSKETMDLVEAFARRINIIPIRIEKESPEYVFNAMLIGFLKAAGKIYAGGVASFEDIDRAWMGIMGAAAGPFGIMDGVGLDTVWNIIDGIAQAQNDPDAAKMAEAIKAHIDRGELGVKTGKGFYDYSDPAFLREGFIEGK